MPRWVALPRALNLGSHNKVAMPALRDALTEAGCSGVRSYVQSGNLVFDSRLRSAARVADLVNGVLRDGFDIDTLTVVRSSADLDAVVVGCPFPDAAAERPKVVQVHFCVRRPTAAALRALQDAAAGEQVAAVDADVVIDYVESVHRSKLSPAKVSRLLETDSTARNWRTVETLAAWLRD